MFFSGKKLLFPQIDINQSQLSRIAYQFHGTVQIELLHDIGAMVLDRFDTDAQPFGDFRFGKALGQHAHDFLFSIGETTVVAITHPGLPDRRFHQPFHHLVGDGTIQEVFALGDRMQALNQPAGS